MELLRRFNRPVFALIAVAVIAGGLRLWHLSRPSEYVFDEVYYAKSGCLYAGDAPAECDVKSKNEKIWYDTYRDVGDWVHPPVGKEMIALGELAFGHNSFGWRISAAFFGTLTCVLTALIAQLLFRKPLWTFIAGVLLATESLNLVQSRVALLDIFLAFWVVLGFLFMVLDRQWIKGKTDRAGALTGQGEAPVLERVLAVSHSLPADPADPTVRDVPETPKASAAPSAALSADADPSQPVQMPRQVRIPASGTVPSPFWRPWRFAAGLAFGLAFATKWSGGTALAGAILLAFLWERTRRKSAGAAHPIGRTLFQEGFGIVLFLVLLPMVVYVVSYARYWTEFGIHPGTWFQMQLAMEQFHRTLNRFQEGTHELTHAYESLPWTWPLMIRPVDFYFKDPGAQILSIGNPVIFWGSIFAVPYMAVAWRVKGDARAGLILVAILAQWLPWFLIASRVQFFFYMTPITPFMVLAMTYSMKDLSEVRLAGSKSRAFLPAVVLIIVASVAVFAFFWPVLIGSPLSHNAWMARMWRSSWI